VRRFVFNLAAAVSLVLCMATLTLWVRGLSRCDDLSIDRYSATEAGVRLLHVAIQSETGVIFYQLSLKDYGWANFPTAPPEHVGSAAALREH
jgi:hypothetical protein